MSLGFKHKLLFLYQILPSYLVHAHFGTSLKMNSSSNKCYNGLIGSAATYSRKLILLLDQAAVVNYAEAAGFGYYLRVALNQNTSLS